MISVRIDNALYIDVHIHYYLFFELKINTY